MTEWKRIPHLPARFEASYDAQIRTVDYERECMNANGTKFIKHVPGRIISQRIKRRGGRGIVQPYVTIYRGTSREDYSNVEMRVAFLVATAFLGVPYDPTDASDLQRWRVRFKDGNVDNCRADNLKWVHQIGEASDGGQERYGDHLADWEARKGSAGSTLQRLYAEVA